MNEFDRSLPRRTVLQGAGIGIGAGLLSGISSPAYAQTSAASGEIWSQDYWAKKGDVKLNLWRKRVGAPRPGEPAKPAVFLVHGSSNSARSSYDLTVPGERGSARHREQAVVGQRLNGGQVRGDPVLPLGAGVP